MSDKILNNTQLESWITFIDLEKQKPVLTIIMLFRPSQNHNVRTFYIQTSDVAVFNQMLFLNGFKNTHFKGKLQGNSKIDVLRQNFTIQMSLFTFSCKN